MVEPTISIYLLCVGFIAGLWDREHQREPLGGQENEGLNQALKAALRTDSLSSASGDTGPDSNLNGHKEVEFDNKEK